MDLDTYDWLTRLVLEGVNHPDCSDWEKGFLKDQEERLEKYKTDTRYSPKQWAILDRVAEKLNFEEKPDAEH